MLAPRRATVARSRFVGPGSVFGYLRLGAIWPSHRSAEECDELAPSQGLLPCRGPHPTTLLGEELCCASQQNWLPISSYGSKTESPSARLMSASASSGHTGTSRHPPYVHIRSRHWETIAYFTAFAAFSMSAAISRGCKRKMAWGPSSSMVSDLARFAMKRSRSGLIIRSPFATTT